MLCTNTNNHRVSQCACIIQEIISWTKSLKQWWSVILLISTKRTILSHFNSLTIKTKSRKMTLKIRVLYWNRHTQVAGSNRLMRSQPFPSWHSCRWISYLQYIIKTIKKKPVFLFSYFKCKSGVNNHFTINVSLAGRYQQSIPFCFY